MTRSSIIFLFFIFLKEREEDYVPMKATNILGGTEQLANLKPLWLVQPLTHWSLSLLIRQTTDWW